MAPALVAARAPVPRGELVLDAARPIVTVRIAGVAMRLRVDPGQWQVVELTPAAAASLPLRFESGHDVEIGAIILPGRVAAGRLEVAGTRRAVTIASHDAAQVVDADADADADADGLIGPDLLPYATIRWRRDDAPPATAARVLALGYDDQTGLAAPDPGPPLHFTLALPRSFATGAAGSRLARDFGGAFAGEATPIPVPFGQTRLARPLRLARPATLAGFRFETVPVRAGDYRGDNPLPADAAAPGDIVVARRVAPQPAQSWVTIAADRLARCAEIAYFAAPRSLTLRCAFDAR